MQTDMNTTFKTNLDLFLLIFKVMFNQDIQASLDVEESSDTPNRSRYRIRNNDISSTDVEPLDVIDPIQITNAYRLLNHFVKDKTKTNIDHNEDEIDIYGRLLALRLRQLPHVERQEVMYEIDGIFLDHCRNLHCPSPRAAIEAVKNFSDSDQYASTLDYFVSEDSNGSVNKIVDEVFRSRRKYKSPEESFDTTLSFESFASFDVPDSLERMQRRRNMSVCNNMTCDATQTYVRNYLPPGLLFECD